MKRVLTVRRPWACLTAALVLALPAGAASVNSATSDEGVPLALKLRFGLAEAIEKAQPDERLPVYIVMTEQASRELVDQVSALARSNSARREAVIDLLRGVAQATQGEVLAILRDAERQGRVTAIRPLWIVNVIGAEMTGDVAMQIAARRDVAYVAYDPKIGIEVFPVDWSSSRPVEPGPIAAPTCGLNIIQAPRVWSELGITGCGVVVGVIDTGLCLTHPDIRNRVWVNPGEIPGNGIDDDGNGFIDDINGWNFESNNNNVNDTNGHGTHTTGTVAGDGTQGTQTGVAPGCKVMVLKFWNSFSGQQSVWDSHQYGVQNGADVLTASLGWPHSRPELNRPMWRQVTENSMAAGVWVTYAAGNEGSCCRPYDAVRTPGDVPRMITAGAIDCNSNVASFSSRGPVTWQNVPPYNDWPYPPGRIKPTTAADGVNTISLAICSGYRALSGTSMATPHHAGVLALMRQRNPNLTHDQAHNILQNTAFDLGLPGDDNDSGRGRIDAYQAVLAAGGCPGCARPGRCAGDTDGDGDIDQTDLGNLLAAYGSQRGDPNYNPCADFDCDDDVDQSNLGELLARFGASCPGCP